MELKCQNKNYAAYIAYQRINGYLIKRKCRICQDKFADFGDTDQYGQEVLP